VRRLIFDQLTTEQVQALDGICVAILGTLAPPDSKSC